MLLFVHFIIRLPFFCYEKACPLAGEVEAKICYFGFNSSVANREYMSSAVCRLLVISNVSVANSVYPDQTAPLGGTV